ncbi:hypothetical protein KR222_002784, partial [Zaprionus bogoriensis]
SQCKHRDIEYDGCERLRHEILALINERWQHAGLPASPKYVQLTSSIQTKMEQLAKDVAHLKVVLSNATTWETSPEEELQRRRIHWDKLSSQQREMQSEFTKATRANYQAGASSSSSSVWQSDAASGSTASARPTDIESLKQTQARILEDQNRGLEALSATISRQRNLAAQLGNEVDDQNSILDNLANSMDRVESGVQRETRNISQVNRRDSTWGYWLVIIALFVAILVVILV